MKVKRKFGAMNVVCSACLTELEVEFKDVIFNDAGHIGVPDFYVKCPECGETIELSNMPQKWVNKLYSEH